MARGRLVRLLAWAGLGVALAACESDGAAPARDGADGSTPDAGAMADAGADAGAEQDGGGLAGGDFVADYCTPLAQLVCERAEACGCGAVVPSGALDVTGCVDQWTARCAESYASVIGAAQSGALRVFGARARDCVAQIAEATPPCELPRATLFTFALCEPLFSGTAALDAPCDVPICADGEGTCREGTCGPRTARGEPCGSEFECATGLVCAEGTCQPPSGEREPCSEARPCAPALHCVAGSCTTLAPLDGVCADTSACGAGLTCDGESCRARAEGPCSETDSCGNLEVCAAPRVCSPRLAIGEACKSDRDCEASLFCDEASHCAARPGLDAPCARGVLCALDLGCDTAGVEPVCKPLPGMGEPCAGTEFGQFACAAGLACLDGQCGAMPGDGDPCAQPNLCGPGLACDFTPEGSVCVPPKSPGASCQNDVVCGALHHCGSEGTCVADQADGTPCRYGNECVGVCGTSDTGALACRPEPAQGDPCSSDDDCPETLACRANPARVACVPELCRAL